MGVWRIKKVTQSCLLLSFLTSLFFRNLRKPSSCVLWYLLDVYFPQFFIELHNWPKSHVLLVLVFQYFLCLEIVVRVLLFYCWHKCVFGHLENVNGFLLFHFKVDFCQKSLGVLLLLDHSAIFKEYLTVAKEISLKFDPLFLGWSFCDGWCPTFDEIWGFESFAGPILNWQFALKGRPNAEKVVGDGAVFCEPGQIGDIRLLSLGLMLMRP